MTPLASILTAARDRIALREHWCRDAFARDNFGNAIDPTSPSAVSWSPGGAFIAVGASGLQIVNAYTALKIASGQMDIGHWLAHDASHDEIIAAFNTAIAQQSAGTDADTMATAHGSEDVA